MSVRFKFKNDLEHTALPCDGFHISVLDLKRAIVRLKRLGRVTDFDLEVINQQDNKPFESEDQLIAKNSTLIIVRRPLPAGHQKVWEEEKLAPQMNLSGGGTGSTLSFSHSAGDDRSEDDKLSAMMSNSTEMYDQKNWLKLRGRANYPSKFPPATYRCIKCNLPGHWVSECPNTKTGFLGSELKRTTGIPRSFLKPALKDTPGAKINPQGLFMVNELEERAYVEKKIDKPMWENEDSNQTETPKVKIPEDLLCPVCKDLLRDCIMMPECACEMCDECARNALIESEENTCPVCGKSKNSPDELIPWRGKRDKVNKFKNSMGAASNLLQRNVHESSQKPTLPDIKLPGQNDFDTVAGLKPSPVYGMSPGMSSTGASPQIDPMESEGPVPGFDPETKSPGTPLETERTSPSQTPNITNAISSENVAIEGTPASTSPSAQDPVGRSASRSPRRRRSPSQTPVEEQPKSRAFKAPIIHQLRVTMGSLNTLIHHDTAMVCTIVVEVGVALRKKMGTSSTLWLLSKPSWSEKIDKKGGFATPPAHIRLLGDTEVLHAPLTVIPVDLHRLLPIIDVLIPRDMDPGRGLPTTGGVHPVPDPLAGGHPWLHGVLIGNC
eukprot:TCALIF_09337-PA protein Name:"Similar to RBBP6 E3 ubiquitin-protein ligase RBBP6 (Homo sapiens)" AED:0.25 eAED:0.26 QI:0/0/0/0.66/1/1/3/0/608